MYEPSYGTHVFLSPSLLVSLSPRLVAPRSTSRSPSLESKNKARIKMPFLVKFQCLFIGEEWKSFEGEIWRWVGEVKHNRFESSGVAQMMMMVMMLPFEEILSKAGWESWASSEMRFLKALDICLQLPANTIQSPSFSCVQIDWAYVWLCQTGQFLWVCDSPQQMGTSPADNGYLPVGNKNDHDGVKWSCSMMIRMMSESRCRCPMVVNRRWIYYMHNRMILKHQSYQSVRLCWTLWGGYDRVLLLSITQLAAPLLLLLKTMAIRHADIINNAWQPFVSNDQSKKPYKIWYQKMLALSIRVGYSE